MSTQKQKRASAESSAFLGVLAVIVVMVNLVSVFLHGRIDATEKEFFSLSDGSRQLAAGLSDRMEIRAYFSEDLPPPHNTTERYLRDLLAEYRDASKGKITVRFIDPKDDKAREEAQRDGVVKVQDQVLEKDSFAVKEGYRGVSFHYLGNTESIARIDRTAGLEYEITQTIKKLVGEKVAIGVLGGHEGPTLGQGLANLRGYLPNYELKEVKADAEIPQDIEALLVVHPELPLSDAELQRINAYVMNGGNLGVFAGDLKFSLAQEGSTATPIETGLNVLLEKWGVKLGNQIVGDAQCGRAPMKTQFGFALPVPYPVAPIVSFDEKQSEHPALFRLDQMTLHFPVPIELTGALDKDAAVETTVLARSTKQSWLLQGENIDLSPRERWAVPGYDGPYVLGVALQGKLPSAYAGEKLTTNADGSAPVEAPERASHEAHVAVFGTGFFLRDETIRPSQGNQIFGGPIAFALNVIDWLANDSDLVAIRAKTVEEPALEVPTNVREAEASIRTAIEEDDRAAAEKAFEERKQALAAWDAKRNLYRWGNSLGLPLAFAIFGVYRWRTRKARRANLKL